MNYIAPYRQLKKDSEAYLILINSKEYLELQVKFDKNYLSLSNELKAIRIISLEVRENRITFTKVNQNTSPKSETSLDILRERTKEKESISNIDIELKELANSFSNFGR